MKIWFNPSEALHKAVAETAARVDNLDSTFRPEIRPAGARFGDYQANGVLPFARRHGLDPKKTAATLCEALSDSKRLHPEWVSWEVGGAGFINFHLSPLFLRLWLEHYRTEEDLRAAGGSLYRDRTVVVDFSSPNTAKQMHVGHLRSMVIGETICRLLSFCGARVIRDNHIGDWGTQFGILIMAIKRRGIDLDGMDGEALSELEELYKEGNASAKADPEALAEAREELLKLQRGDAENRRLWEKINALSYAAFEEIYDRMGIHFDVVLGESFYRDRCEFVYHELSRYGIAEESEGALVVFHPEHDRFKRQPFIIRKSDGASKYETTDLATLYYRIDHFKADAVIYVVDSRQSDHFEQLFLTAEKWFKAKGIKLPELEHVRFGTILGKGGKAIKTRDGEPVKLKDLLQEARDRAFAIVTEKNPGLSAEERRRVASVVGLGAVRYADLMQNRSSDYIFSWGKMLSFEGNTAPYLLYAAARLYSIFRKAKIDPEAVADETESPPLETDREIELARKLAGFGALLNQTMEDLRPHFLCAYLYELAGAFSAFYNADKVIVEDPATRRRRLMLCGRTLTVLETGLHLLGLETLRRM